MADVVTTLPGRGEIRFVWSSDDQIRLEVAGEIDAADADALEDLATSVHPLSVAAVHLDATLLRFVDVAGIRALRRLAAQLTGGGGSVTASGLGAVAAGLWQAVAPTPSRPHPRPGFPAGTRLMSPGAPSSSRRARVA